MSARHTRKRGKKATYSNNTKRLCTVNTDSDNNRRSASGSSHVEEKLEQSNNSRQPSEHEKSDEEVSERSESDESQSEKSDHAQCS